MNSSALQRIIELSWSASYRMLELSNNLLNYHKAHTVRISLGHRRTESPLESCYSPPEQQYAPLKVVAKIPNHFNED